MTLSFKEENRKILLSQTNHLLFRVLFVFVIYSSILSLVSFYIGSLGRFIVVDLIFNVLRIIALFVVNKVIKNEDIKYFSLISLGIVGFVFSFITIRDYVGIFYGALIYCYITIIIVSLKKKVVIAFTAIGVLTYLILFYYYPYKNVDLDVAYYLSQIGFVLIYNYIVINVMEYFKIYEKKIYDQIDLIKEQAVSIRKSEERYRLVFDASQNGLWDYDMASGTVFYSDYALELLGTQHTDKQDFVNLHTQNIAKEDIMLVKHYRDAVLNEKKDYYTIEFKYILDENIYWYEEKVTILKDEKGDIKRIGGSISNITEKKQKDRHIHMLAFYDTLTKLPNRSYFYDEVNRITDSRNGLHTDFAIAIMDLDDFKVINDIFGHQVGDEVLVFVAERLSKLPYQNTLIARLGGDEFGILFYGNYHEENIKPILNDIINSITDEIIIKEHKIQLTASIGASFYPTDGNTIEVLHKNSELALYNTKIMGKNSYSFFNANLAEALSKKVIMGSDLKIGIKDNELLLHYQPLYRCESKSLIGFEALARWQSPKYGRVSPGEFIPLAEEIGVINEIGKWVYKEAGLFAMRINELYQGLTVSFNVSSSQVMDHFFIEEIINITETYRINPNYMCIEITETAVMTAEDYAIANLNKLRRLGFRISIDDFGTGYSSLSYLKNLPAQIIKIDKSFIDHIEESIMDSMMLKTIISLGKVLNMFVVAEGVEKEGQYYLLKEYDCDIVQGYLFSKPIPESEAYNLVKSFC